MLDVADNDGAFVAIVVESVVVKLLTSEVAGGTVVTTVFIGIVVDEGIDVLVSDVVVDDTVDVEGRIDIGDT